MTITTRMFEEDDLEEVLAVLIASLGESPILKRTPELFSWKHRRNPFGPSIIVLAESDSQVVGVRAVMRWEMSDPAGNRISCGRMVDTATHPDFQRLGIFRRLTMEVLEECRASGVQLLFNTPNSQSRPGYLSMGWKEVGAIGVMLRPSLRMWRRDPAIDDVLPEAAALDSPLLSWSDRPADGLRTPRSPEYLSWRYTGHPFAPYVGAGDAKGEVVARLNHRRGRRELVVSDLFGNARSALRSLIGEAEADYAVAWFSKGSPERSVSIGTGLVPLPGVTALHLVANPLVDLDLDVFDLATWDLSLGDLELL